MKMWLVKVLIVGGLVVCSRVVNGATTAGYHTSTGGPTQTTTGYHTSTGGPTQTTTDDYGVCNLNNFCRNGGTCSGYRDYRRQTCYSCSCQYYYYGPNCQDYYWNALESTTPGYNYNICSYNNPCGNGGSCSSYSSNCYQCYCFSGYSGYNCEDYTITAPTTSASSMTTTGYHTSTRTPTQTTTDEYGVCNLNNFCRNGGTCSGYRDYRSQTCYNCSCQYPYYGPNCQDNYWNALESTTPGYIYNICSYNNPCGNRGSCSSYSSNCYRCYCNDGYSGNNCEDYTTATPTISAPPMTTADYTITAQSPSAPPMTTPDGYGVCTFNNVCTNGGNCSEYKSSLINCYFCDCKYPYYGTTCQADYRQSLWETTTGYNYNVCSYHNPCGNRGSCSSYSSKCYQCDCYSGYSGHHCQDYNTAAPTPSAPAMTTTDGHGVCNFNNFCRNGGNCSEYRGHGQNCYKCDCEYPYYGPNCQDYRYSYMYWTTTTGYNYNICSYNNPCGNGGSCVSTGYNSNCYQCHCNDGYSGNNCEDYDVGVTCENGIFHVEVNKHWFAQNHPNFNMFNNTIYFGSCRVSVNDISRASGSYSFSSCGTTISESYTHIIYSNRLYVDESDSGSVITRDKAGYTIQCKINRDTSVVGSFRTENISRVYYGEGNYTAYMRFSRNVASGYIYSYPASIGIDEQLYSHVVLTNYNNSLKPVIEDCVARTNATISSKEYYLIRNRCPVDSTTTMLSSGHGQAEFVFRTFDFVREEGQVYIMCRIHVCTDGDSSYRCTAGCGHRRKRSADETEPISLFEGPFVYDASEEDSGITTTIAVGSAVGGAVCVGFVVTIFIKIKSFLVSKAAVAPAGYTSVPQTV